jgi:hypothetical protein
MTIADFLQFMFRLTVSNSTLLRDLPSLQRELGPNKQMLIPYSREEVELLSMTQTNVKKKGGFTKLVTGMFDTIYFEHLLAFAMKTYSTGNKLILIASSEDEFIYLRRNNTTHVYINQRELGVLTPDDKLYNTRGQLLATIDGADHLPNHSVFIRDKNMGFVNNPKFRTTTTSRAFSLLSQMNDEDTMIFLALTLMNLVEEAQLSKKL